MPKTMAGSPFLRLRVRSGLMVRRGTANYQKSILRCWQFQDDAFAFSSFDLDGLALAIVRRNKIRIGDVIGLIVESEDLVLAWIQSAQAEVSPLVCQDLLVNIVTLA